MSGKSSSAAEWFTRLSPALPPDDLPHRPDDPRLGEVVEFWRGDTAALRPGRAVLLGFPQDEGVCRNGGRPGAAEAPPQIRRFLYRLTPWDGAHDIDLAALPPLDAGDVRIGSSLEESQQALAEVVGGILRAGAVPVVLGGGHETAYGHYLGYLAAGRPVGIINIDAHLDVRPCIDGKGHSGSPFRQALEHPTHPLEGTHYVCLGAQPSSVSRQHWLYVRQHGCVVRWAGQIEEELLIEECERLAAEGCQVYVSIDADAVAAETVPGVSAPNPGGLAGSMVIEWARQAGRSPHIASLDLVEINPRFDRDGQSARWAALAVWHFLAGLAERNRV
ncbi:MAG TPA: formimidoylglutamase [Gemmataceae bacterium]|nr:formimidoylglutamase [Gemmataceae bacterium]